MRLNRILHGHNHIRIDHTKRQPDHDQTDFDEINGLCSEGGRDQTNIANKAHEQATNHRLFITSGAHNNLTIDAGRNDNANHQRGR